MLRAVVLSFIAVFLIVIAIWLWYNEHKESPSTELKRRLRRMAREKHYERMPDELRAEILKETPAFDSVLAQLPALKNLDKFIDQCGLKMHPAAFMFFMSLSFMLPFVAILLLKNNWMLAAFIAAATFAAACLYMISMKKRRMDKFTEQLPEALFMIARSLRAGHSLNSAVELIGNEFHEPLGPLFKTAYEQQKLGLRISEALQGMLHRVDSLDLRFFVIVININSEVGGNLSDILDKLAGTIRERLKLRRQVKVFTAQGRLSGYILAILPVFSFIMLQYFLLPGYEDVFFTKSGRWIIFYAIMSQFIGMMIIKRIINIRI